jgi:hypothetical protein
MSSSTALGSRVRFPASKSKAGWRPHKALHSCIDLVRPCRYPLKPHKVSGGSMTASKPWLSGEAKRAVLKFQQEFIDLDDSFDTRLLPASKRLLHNAIDINSMSATFAAFGLVISKHPFEQQLLLHYSAATECFRLYHIDCDYATPDTHSMLEHLKRLEEAIRLSRDQLHSELRKLSELQGPEEVCLTVSGPRSRVSSVGIFEMLDALQVAQRFPPCTNPPILKRSRSNLPFDFMKVGEVVEIGAYTKPLLNRVRVAICVHHRIKDRGRFKAVVDTEHDKVLLWREA